MTPVAYDVSGWLYSINGDRRPQSVGVAPTALKAGRRRNGLHPRMSDDLDRFASMERMLQELNQQLAAFQEWCHVEMESREARIAKLARANAWAQAELARLRMIINSVGAIASQAEPPPELAAEEDLGA